MAKTVNSIQTQAESFLVELLQMLGVTAEVKAEFDKNASDKALKVNIKSSDGAGLLIGSHGSTLTALQSILALTLRQNQGEWVPVSLDVDGWRERQDQYLIDMAKQSADRACETGKPQYLYNLSPAERRVVHMALQDEAVETESEGEGSDRYLIVKPK